MKRSFFYLLCMLIAISCYGHSQSVPHAFANSDIKGFTYILSYPRSGRTWITYMLLTLYDLNFLDPETVRNQQTSLENGPPYRCSHLHSDLQTVDRNENKIIVFLRNYKECIRRNYNCDTNLAYKSIISNTGQMQLYIGNLEMYDNWSPENRLIIFYEDVIFNPRESFEKLADFLGLDISKIDDFMNDFEKHRQLCLNKYSHSQGYSASQGIDVLHHTKQYTPLQIMKINERVRLNNPDLWEKYLFRYD